MIRISTTSFRASFSKCTALVRCHPAERIEVTNRSVAVFVVVSPEYIEGLEASTELLSNPKVRREIARGLADIKAGRMIGHQQVRQAVGLMADRRSRPKGVS
jgi:PHD/YefM family antitoxin component YafN of YafNO toxin-antitoxin module